MIAIHRQNTQLNIPQHGWNSFTFHFNSIIYLFLNLVQSRSKITMEMYCSSKKNYRRFRKIWLTLYGLFMCWHIGEFIYFKRNIIFYLDPYIVKAQKKIWKELKSQKISLYFNTGKLQ